MNGESTLNWPLTCPRIGGHFNLLVIHGADVSSSLISRVTDAVLGEVSEWQNRELSEVYPIIYLDAIHLKIRTDGRVQNRAVYLALTVNMEGHKELLGLWIGEAEGAKFWFNVLTELNNCGVKVILISAVDGLTGFPGTDQENYLPYLWQQGRHNR